MCLVKKPKIPDTSKTEKDPPIVRNSILDGMLGNIAALRGAGRNGMRIDLLNPLAIPVGGGTGVGVGGGGGGSGGSSTSAGTSSGTSGSGSTDPRVESGGTTTIKGKYIP